ncbi:response regulator [Paenibacillus sp. GCM10023252]|uniref:response regulator n=1 Tax=Paenibacillus sp. GCM10023252 TaxID=3252649 RepID=UPI00361F1E54
MYNILLVDDEKRVREGLSEWVVWEDFGFRLVGTSANGVEALEFMAQVHVHLLITDIKMPVIDGLVLARESRLQDPLLKIIILSGFNEFNYAKKAIDCGVSGYLLKPVDKEELEGHLREIRVQLDQEFLTKAEKRAHENLARDRYLQQLVSGYLLGKEAGAKLLPFGVELDGDWYRVVLWELDDLHRIVEESLSDAKLYQYGMRNIVEEMVEERGYGYVYEDTEGSIGLLLRGSELESPAEEAMDFMKLAEHNMKTFLKVRVSWGMGDPVLHPGNLKNSRLQARYDLESRKAGGQPNSFLTGLITREDIPVLSRLNWDSTELILAVEEGDIGRMEEQIDALFAEIDSNKLTGPAIQGILFALLLGFHQLYKRHSIATDDPVVTEETLRLSESADGQGLQERLARYCRFAAKLLYAGPASGSNKVIAQVQKYVVEHFAEELSLKSIAQLFYMNSAYLGQLFKKETGDHFLDYMHKVRIQYIKKQMKAGQGQVGQIVMDAGYKNTGYFYKQFRKLEGISFQEYQENKKESLNSVNL